MTHTNTCQKGQTFAARRSPRALASTLLAAMLAAAYTFVPVEQACAQALPSLSIAPLLDDEGRLMATDPSAVPRDGKALTRMGLYATGRQAGQLEQTMGERLVALRVECCGDAAVERAVQKTWAPDAATHMPADTPVLVRGEDLRLAARVVDRLNEAGLSRVWLVTTP